MTATYVLGKSNDLTSITMATFVDKFVLHSSSFHFIKLLLDVTITDITNYFGDFQGHRIHNP
jgi:hypothetical protein